MSPEEVGTLGLTHLLGTSVLRAYMHGYFVDNRLYHKARAVSDPFAYDRYRESVIQKKVEEERSSRISVARKVPRVNAALAARLEQKQAEQNARQDRAAGKGEGEGEGGGGGGRGGGW